MSSINKTLSSLSCDSLIGKRIALDGLPGAGKTTLGNSIKRYLESKKIKTVFLSEYVNSKLLNLYISDMSKYGFMFQVAMLKEKKMIYERAEELAQSGYVVIIDRSRIGDLSFARMQRENYGWSDDEWNVYLSMYDELNPVDIIINLDTSVEVAFERKTSRGRDGESSYTLEYYNNLKNVQDKELEKRASDVMITVDWNDDLSVITTTSDQVNENQVNENQVNEMISSDAFNRKILSPAIYHLSS